MIEHPGKYVSFLIDHKITERQFLLCYLLYTDGVKRLPDGRFKYIDKKRAEQSSPIANMYRFIDYCNKEFDEPAWSNEDLDVLIKRGFVERHGNSKSPDMLKLTDKFIDSLFATDTEFEQFWDSYPSHIDNFTHHSGPSIPLKVTDKEKLENRFLKIVRTKQAFAELMGMLEWAKENNQINMNIENYLTSEQWKETRKLKEKYQEKSGFLGSDEL